MYKKVILKPNKEDSVRRFHPWIFSGAIKIQDPDILEGEIVAIYNSDHLFLALGHYQTGSITVRILSFENEKIDQNFWTKKIRKAFHMRHALGLIRPDNNTYRLVHGEGDNLPGLIVDIYHDVAIVQAHSPGMHTSRHQIANAIKEVMPQEIYHVYYKSETTLPGKTDFDSPENGYLIGNKEEHHTAIENGLTFYADWLKGQKTGFFIDQRDNRSLLEKYAKGRKVLNMFCYTGGFSFYAMRGGATQVHSVDSSAKAIMLTKQNIAINFPQDIRHQAFTEDAFNFLANSQPHTYDLIVLDPPAFAKRRSATRNALQGYKRLNATAIKKIAPGGILFTFSCSQAISKEAFRLAVFSAAASCGRTAKILHQLTQPADHPVNIYHPEGEYLKGLVLYIE